MRRLSALLTVFAMLLACEEENACDRYADYVCACHADEEGFDCEQLMRLADNADSTVIASCDLDLDDLRAEDQAAGETCAL